jgi:hypothetical protein
LQIACCGRSPTRLAIDLHESGTAVHIPGKDQDFSKIEAGKMELWVERFEVRLMIEEVVGVVQPPVKKNGNQLEVKRVVPLYSGEDWTFFKKCSGMEAAASQMSNLESHYSNDGHDCRLGSQ